jgi:hypothetical protein
MTVQVIRSGMQADKLAQFRRFACIFWALV